MLDWIDAISITLFAGLWALFLGFLFGPGLVRHLRWVRYRRRRQRVELDLWGKRRLGR